MPLKTDLRDIPNYSGPSWCLNGHFHTIGCSLLSKQRDPYHKRMEISTPDDDFLDLDIYKVSSQRPVVVLFHGLEGSSKRYYITELAHILAKNNYSVVGVNFRGCSGRLNRQPRFYHSGETQDLMTVFRWVKERFPEAPIGSVGFSLGGNALLKSLGEERASHPVRVAVGVSIPYDLALGAQNISSGFNRVYEYNFVRTMKRKLEEKRERYPELPKFTGNTLYDFDEQVTAPLHGFSGADEYYAICSSSRFLSDIKKPSLLIHSLDDPICPPGMIPKEKIEANTNLSYAFTEEGGHVGFWSDPPGWLNRTIVNFLEQNFDQ
ncbi:MAG: alpha/beta fold hydrolase [Balneolaceae bacterium]|nr:alpha/beta fold hydrolase [Balneolaceae bacterium]